MEKEYRTLWGGGSTRTSLAKLYVRHKSGKIESKNAKSWFGPELFSTWKYDLKGFEFISLSTESH